MAEVTTKWVAEVTTWLSLPLAVSATGESSIRIRYLMWSRFNFIHYDEGKPKSIVDPLELAYYLEEFKYSNDHSIKIDDQSTSKQSLKT